MKRFCAFALAACMLFTCSACQKPLPAQETASAQAAEGETEQIVSGVSVRVPAVQYRLARTELEGLTMGNALLPYSGGAVLTGSIFSGSADDPVRTEAAAYYTPECACTVQELPVSPDGLVVQAALAGEQLYYIETYQNPDGEQWLLHAGGQEIVLDEALSGVSNLTAMAVQDEAVLLAADGSCVISCAMDGTRLWKQPAAEIERFFRTRDGTLLGWAQPAADLPACDGRRSAGYRRRPGGMVDGGFSGYRAGASGDRFRLRAGRRRVHAPAAAPLCAGCLYRVRRGTGKLRFS